MPALHSWILVLVCTALLVGALVLLWQRGRRRKLPPLPLQWPLSPRPVFTVTERRAYRHLREAMPDHVILAKLPLVRFTQPDDPQQLHYWYRLLGGLNLSFAVCSPSGRVLVALDIDAEPAPIAPRNTAIKQAVLAACHIHYLRCHPEHLPSAAQLRHWLGAQDVGHPAAADDHHTPESTAPRPAPEPDDGARRASQPAWHDSELLHDSFFDLEERLDAGLPPGTFSRRKGSGG